MNENQTATVKNQWEITKGGSTVVLDLHDVGELCKAMLYADHFRVFDATRQIQLRFEDVRFVLEDDALFVICGEDEDDDNEDC